MFENVFRAFWCENSSFRENLFLECMRVLHKSRMLSSIHDLYFLFSRIDYGNLFFLIGLFIFFCFIDKSRSLYTLMFLFFVLYRV